MMNEIASSMPKTHLRFIESFLGTLINPVETFELLSAESREDTHQLPGAIAVVALVFSLDALRLISVDTINLVALNVSGEILGGVLLWLLSGAVVGLPALCFGAPGANVRAVFVTLGWSLLPLIFLAPLTAFHTMLDSFVVLLLSLPLLWVLILQIIAIKASLQMKSWQAMMLVFVIPPMLSLYQLLQFLQSMTASFGSMLG